VRRVVLLVLAAAIAVTVQTTLAHRIPFLPGGPDLILVLAVYLGLHFHSAGGALGAFLLGYLLDTASGVAPGLFCLTMTLVFGVVYLLSQRLWMENPVSNVAAVALGEAIKITVVTLFFAMSGQGERSLGVDRADVGPRGAARAGAHPGGLLGARRAARPTAIGEAS
jgi:rod shape-determining protein MreD